MAIDTPAKRFSMLNFGSPTVNPLIIPDGTIDAGDRYHFLGLYSGITLGTPVVVTVLSFGIYGLISGQGVGVEGEISVYGRSVTGEITSTHGILGHISSKGGSVIGEISSTGVSIEGEL